MLWLAAVAAAIVVDRAFKRARIKADAVGMVAIAVVAGIVGSKMWHVLRLAERISGRSAGGFCGIARVLPGTAGSSLASQRWFCKDTGKNRSVCGRWICAAPAAAIGYGIGRIGCFLSGDGCYGIPIQPIHLLGFTFRPWGMAFPNGIEPVYRSGLSHTAL